MYLNIIIVIIILYSSSSLSTQCLWDNIFLCLIENQLRAINRLKYLKKAIKKWNHRYHVVLHFIVILTIFWEYLFTLQYSNVYKTIKWLVNHLNIFCATKCISSSFNFILTKGQKKTNEKPEIVIFKYFPCFVIFAPFFISAIKTYLI